MRSAAFRLALLLSVSMMAGCVNLRASRLAFAEAAGFERLAPGIYAEPGADPQLLPRLRADMAIAREAIVRAYGGVQSVPTVHVCLTESCYVRFGGGTSIATTYGDLMLLSPRGRNWHFIAHEWSHAELQSRLYSSAWRRVPRWFDEGLAVAVSEAPEHAEAHYSMLHARGFAMPSRDELLGMRSFDQWQAAIDQYSEPENRRRRARGEPGISPIYSSAGHELRPWLARQGPTGLLHLIARLNAGDDFMDAYCATLSEATRTCARPGMWAQGVQPDAWPVQAARPTP